MEVSKSQGSGRVVPPGSHFKITSAETCLCMYVHTTIEHSHACVHGNDHHADQARTGQRQREL